MSDNMEQEIEKQINKLSGIIKDCQHNKMEATDMATFIVGYGYRLSSEPVAEGKLSKCCLVSSVMWGTDSEGYRPVCAVCKKQFEPATSPVATEPKFNNILEADAIHSRAVTT